ncbi:MAG: mevalonate kinase family protein [Planctomycetota bacterium]|jgi:glucuronokinase
MTIETRAYARVGLLGNPSDGYGGKTIAVTVKNFFAQAWIEPSPELRIEPRDEDLGVYPSLAGLVSRVKLHGYYGGDRLVKAAIMKFHEYCEGRNIDLTARNFTISYRSTIPRQVGLAGSSAIITASLRALMEFFEVEIPKENLPSMILAAETEELDINAGLMDRVTQVYEGCMYMNLDPWIVKSEGHGLYERIEPKTWPDLYLAYNPGLGKVSGQVLNDIRVRFDAGDPFVLEILSRLASLAEEGKQALLSGDFERLAVLMNENFDLRSWIMRISEGNRRMIDAARACGASAKFAGSGGTIIGIFDGVEMFDELSRSLEQTGATVIKPLL